MKRNARKLLIFMTLVLFPFLCIVGVFSLCEYRNHVYDISIHSNGEVASLISGEFYGTSVTDEEDGLQFLDTLQREYGFDNARNEFLFDKVIDASGGRVFKYNQVHQGVPVYGRSLSVFVDENGRVISVSGNYKNTNANVVKVDLNEFETKFKTEYGIDEIFSLKPVIFNQGDNDTLAVMLNCVYDGITSDVIACYDNLEICQVASASPNTVSSLASYTLTNSYDTTMADASGNVVNVRIETYSSLLGGSINILSDSSRNIFMAVMADGKTISNSNFFEYAEIGDADSMVVEAYKNLVKCYDFYANGSNFGTSILGLKNEAGKEIDLIAVVHAVESLGKSYDNAAYWILNASHSSYAYFLFGDGGTNAVDYATSVDVVGHEYQHGITTSICNLVYLNEAGAINEAISDIFGALIEGHDLTDDDFWLMGEDIMVSDIAFRDMKNPSNPLLGDEYPDSVGNMYPLCDGNNCSHTTCDYGGVHFNSVILTHATYKMYSSNPGFFTKFRIGELWYNTLVRLSETSTFIDFRIQMESAAKALGYSNDVIEDIQNSFIEVGIILPEEELSLELFLSQDDAASGVNSIEKISTSELGKITLPASQVSPNATIHYCWTDGEHNYMPGDEYTVGSKSAKLWGIYISPNDVSSSGIELKGDEGNGNELVGEFGSITNPYQIHSAAEFLYFGYLINNSSTNAQYNSAYYNLKADIYLNNIQHTPVGINETYHFAGSFGGGNHTVFGLNLSKSGLLYAGLFGVNAGSVYSLAIGIGETTTSATYAGSIAGANYGSISTCYSKLSILGTETVGGLVGVTYSNAGTSILNSYTEGNISGAVAGGIAGAAISKLNTNYNKIFSSYVGNVYATGDITGNIVGGITGVSNGYYFVNCITTGRIRSNSDNPTMGGVVGLLTDVPYGIETSVTSEIYSGVMSAKVVSYLENEGSEFAGLIVGKIDLSTSYARVSIENNTLKRQTVVLEVGNLSNQPTEVLKNIVYSQSTISDDGAYEGVFDFDDLAYYTNANKWTIARGVSLFNLESVWRIVEAEKMPRIMTYDFWINHAASDFAGGDGVNSPFQISSAEELARLALVVGNQARYQLGWNVYNYADASYVLTKDIDLTGKIWVSIGLTIYQYNQSNKVEDVAYNGFNGVFDGGGHTISNMNTMSVYSCADDQYLTGYYYAYEYNSGLFGIVGSGQTRAVIKSFSMRNVSVSGSYAAPAISQLVGSAEITGIKIHSGNVSGSSVAGGIVAIVGSTESGNSINANISNCMSNAILSSRRIGGIVGSISNNAHFDYYDNLTVKSTKVKIYNSVFRGKIYGIGDDVFNGSSYYGLFAGGIVGVAANSDLQLYNNIYIGNMDLYTAGFAGGLIGASGYVDKYVRNQTTTIILTSSETSITSSHNKLTGDINFMFGGTQSVRGGYVGGILSNNLTTVSIADTSSSSNLNISSVGQIGGSLSEDMDPIFVADGYDYTSYSYYSSEDNFNQTYAWTDTSSMIVTISFVDHDGDVVGEPVRVLYGSTLPDELIINEIPENFSAIDYDYVFDCWNKKDGKIYDEDCTISARYVATKRTYVVKYVLSDGTIIDTLNAEYGSKINQDVEAPKKQGNFFFSYEFLRWDFESDTVTGDITGVAVYRLVVGENLLLLVICALIVFVIGGVIIRNIKSRRA